METAQTALIEVEEFFGDRNNVVRIETELFQRLSARTLVLTEDLMAQTRHLLLLQCDTEFGRSTELQRLTRLTHVGGEAAHKVKKQLWAGPESSKSSMSETWCMFGDARLLSPKKKEQDEAEVAGSDLEVFSPMRFLVGVVRRRMSSIFWVRLCSVLVEADCTDCTDWHVCSTDKF